jgi:hypothetical protein
MSRLEAYGFSVDVPRGWDGEIYRRAGDDPSTARASIEGDGTANPVVHLANFPLPAGRGDYGSGAVERMRPSDVLVCLLEFDREAASTALFATEGLPALRPADFSEHTMQRTIAGLSGAQAFVRVNDRAICVYAVIGATRSKQPLVSSVNQILRGVEVQ